MVTLKIIIRDTKQLHELIIKSGFSIRGFGVAAGISTGYVNQVLNGKRNPSPQTAKKISDALRKEFEDIFFIENGYKSDQSA